MQYRVLLVFVSWFSLLSTQCSLAKDPPNIILLFADDQRADTIAAHGNEHIKTPNLDRLAREGFSFRQNYCAGSYSGAVCVASRAMLMTGQHWLQLPPGEVRKRWQGLPLMPELLREQAGYRSYAIGKWHNGLSTLTRAFHEGSCLYMGGMMDHVEYEIQDLVDGQLTEKRRGEEFSSTTFADAAIHFLESPQTKPFFLYVAFTAPHDARNPPTEYREHYYQNPPPLPENFLPLHPFYNSPQVNSGRDESLAAWPRTEAVIQDQLSEYYGLITHLDEQVGRIFDTLRDTPHADNTIVIYTADHGLAMGSHGLLGKQNIYEMSMQCPLIVWGPSIPAGQSSESFTHVHDLFATICGLAEIKAPTDVDSRDLSSIWEGEQSSVRDQVFLPFQDSQRSIRDAEWKLHVYPQINHRLLFHVGEDPHELNNKIESPEAQVHYRRLLKEMQQAQAELGDMLALESFNPRPIEPKYDNARRKPDRWQPAWIREKYFAPQ